MLIFLQGSSSMIPIKLQLKNFLSYGSTLQVVDFTPYHLICLSGKNGHGKSALLDAITWAIWGQARKISGVAKPDAHLLRLGQSQMLVIFDFEFNRQHYRIRREYAITYGKHYASLDFGIVKDDKMVALTHKTIRETQATIETTLGLDFDAFINSAFLRQGQSNEFSKKSPKERKDVLGTILGLNHYEIIRKKAVDKVKQANLEVLHLNKFQEKNKLELQKLPELLNSLATVNQKLTVLIQQEKDNSQQKNILEKEKEHFLKQKNQQNLLLMNYDQKNQEEKKLQLQVRSLYSEWKKIHKKYLHYTPNSDLDEQKKVILEKITVQQQVLQKNLELKEKLLSFRQQEQSLKNSLSQKHQQKIQTHELTLTTLQMGIENKSKVLFDLENQHKNSCLEFQQNQKEIERLQREITAHEKLESQVTFQAEQFEKRKMFYHQWVAQANLIKIEGDNLQQKQKFTHDENNPSCPLCEQNLSASRKKFLKLQFAKQEQFLRHRLQRLTLIIKNLKNLLLNQHAHLDTLKKDLEHKKIMLIKLDDLSKALTKIKVNQSDLELQITKIIQEKNNLEKEKKNEEIALKNTMQQEKSIFSEDPEYTRLVTANELLQKELDANKLDQIAYQQLHDQLIFLEQQRMQTDKIKQELTLQQERKNQVRDLCNSLRTVKKTKNECAQLLKTFDSLDIELKKLDTKETQIFNNAMKLQQEKEELLHHKGSLENERIKLMQQEQDYKQQEVKIMELENLCTDYQAIATAVSKDGIQALIIEHALPEIEHETNILLGQLTDNQAQIIIESLRDLKKGGTKETLDIKISDAAGIRPYELFSGGEAFRIDFALRLAISKLLAHRAGTSLQTLIIDEGFGSQDEEGLSHIMDALYKIQNNFSKIIIVSHLASMKDQFPVHFFIEKGSQGSSVRVIEQG